MNFACGPLKKVFLNPYHCQKCNERKKVRKKEKNQVQNFYRPCQPTNKRREESNLLGRSDIFVTAVLKLKFFLFAVTYKLSSYSPGGSTYCTVFLHSARHFVMSRCGAEYTACECPGSIKLRLKYDPVAKKSLKIKRKMKKKSPEKFPPPPHCKG